MYTPIDFICDCGYEITVQVQSVRDFRCSYLEIDGIPPRCPACRRMIDEEQVTEDLTEAYADMCLYRGM